MKQQLENIENAAYDRSVLKRFHKIFGRLRIKYLGKKGRTYCYSKTDGKAFC